MAISRVCQVLKKNDWQLKFETNLFQEFQILIKHLCLIYGSHISYVTFLTCVTKTHKCDIGGFFSSLNYLLSNLTSFFNWGFISHTRSMTFYTYFFRSIEASIERCCTQVGLRVPVALGARLLLVRQRAEGKERREALDAWRHGMRHRIAKAQRRMFRRAQMVCAEGCSWAFLYCVLYWVIVSSSCQRFATLVRQCADLSFFSFTVYWILDMKLEVYRNA